MGIENNRELIVNCLPLTSAEQAQFMRAAKSVPQEFVGDPAQRGNMAWTAIIPEELKAQVTAIVGNVDPGTCRQCPKLEWLQTWSAGVDKYQRPGILQPGSMLTNATGAYGQSVSEYMFAMMWAIMKNLHICAASNTNATWQDAGRAITPDGKTALMIGTGDIGSHFARLCKALPVSSTASVCCSSTTRRLRSSVPRAHRHRMRTAKRGRIRRFRIMGTGIVPWPSPESSHVSHPDSNNASACAS